VWILLLQYIYDAAIVTRHCRDEMKVEVQFHPGPFSRCWIKYYTIHFSRTSDHIILIYTCDDLLYVWILLLQYIYDATIVTRHCRDEMEVEVQFHPGPFSRCWIKYYTIISVEH